MPLQVITNQDGDYNYLLSLPRDYTSGPARRWPLLLFLHGAGERGADIANVTRYGPPRLLAGAAELSAEELAARETLATTFITVAPQCPQLTVWADNALLRLLDHLGATLSVDSGRVYLTGISMGAFGGWSLAMRYPERFAALVPICGGGRMADIAAREQDRRDALISLGVWAFHGAGDRVVPVEESVRMVDALKRAGARDVRLTVYPDLEHDSWTPTYATAELYAWLLRHHR